MSNRPSPPDLRECLGCDNPTRQRDPLGCARCQLCQRLEAATEQLGHLMCAMHIRFLGASVQEQAAQHPLYNGGAARPFDWGRS